MVEEKSLAEDFQLVGDSSQVPLGYAVFPKKVPYPICISPLPRNEKSVGDENESAEKEYESESEKVKEKQVDDAPDNETNEEKNSFEEMSTEDLKRTFTELRMQQQVGTPFVLNPYPILEHLCFEVFFQQKEIRSLRTFFFNCVREIFARCIEFETEFCKEKEFHGGYREILYEIGKQELSKEALQVIDENVVGFRDGDQYYFPRLNVKRDHPLGHTTPPYDISFDFCAVHYDMIFSKHGEIDTPLEGFSRIYREMDKESTTYLVATRIIEKLEVWRFDTNVSGIYAGTMQKLYEFTMESYLPSTKPVHKEACTIAGTFTKGTFEGFPRSSLKKMWRAEDERRWKDAERRKFFPNFPEQVPPIRVKNGLIHRTDNLNIKMRLPVRTWDISIPHDVKIFCDADGILFNVMRKG